MDIKKIYSARTEDVEIEVLCQYQASLSHATRSRFVFSYQVKIINHSPFSVQLLRRTWRIFDAADGHRTVEGDGVVGAQPVISPGENYTYSSWCPLTCPLGYMYGHFDMVKQANGALIKVEIPRFELIADPIFN